MILIIPQKALHAQSRDRVNLPQYVPRGARDLWKRAPDCGCGDLNWLS